MKFRFALSSLLAATLAAAAWAQTPPPAAASGSQRIQPARRLDKPDKRGKAVIPDPNLLDGSAMEAEKRPLYGLLSEIEMGEKEGKGPKISPEAGQAGNSAETDKEGAGKNPAAQTPGASGSDAKITEGPAAPAEGIQVADLKVPEGATSGGSDPNAPKPRDLQIGDASLQIQSSGKNAPNVVGVEGSSSQQYEKKLPAGGQQTDNRNRGVEKGRVVPKGL